MDKFQPLNIKVSGRKATREEILTTNFKELAEGIGEIAMPKTGWELFLYAFTRRDALYPGKNVWCYDLGKLVVPNVFIEVDLMLHFVDRYDDTNRVITNIEGRSIL